MTQREKVDVFIELLRKRLYEQEFEINFACGHDRTKDALGTHYISNNKDTYTIKLLKFRDQPLTTQMLLPLED